MPLARWPGAPHNKTRPRAEAGKSLLRTSLGGATDSAPPLARPEQSLGTEGGKSASTDRLHLEVQMGHPPASRRGGQTTPHAAALPGRARVRGQPLSSGLTL